MTPTALLTRALAFDVPGAAWRPPDEPLPDRRWMELLVPVRAYRAEGPLWAAVESGAWPATDEQRLDLGDQHRRAMALALILEQELLDLVTAFAARGIEHRILKGPAIAHLDELDPARRAFGDLDVLVRAEDIDAAVALLAARGGVRRYAEPRPGFDRLFSKGAAFAFHEHLEVDLHRTLTPGPFGLTLPLRALWAAEPDHLELAGQKVAALPRPARFVHACLHALLGQALPRPTALRDLALTAPRDRDELDRALELAGDDAALVVREAVREAARVLDWGPPAPLAAWSRSVRGTARARRWLDDYRDARRSTARLSIGSLEAVPGVRAKVAYATAVLTPRASSTPLVERWRRGITGLTSRPAR